MAKLNCPECGKRLKFGDDQAGKRVACPGCGHAFRLPPAGGVIMPDPPQPPPRRPRAASATAPRTYRYTRGHLADAFFQGGGICGAVVGAISGFLLSFLPKDEFRPLSLAFLGGFVGYFAIGLLGMFVLAPLYWRLFYGRDDYVEYELDE
jgi:hypothetical protein